MITKHESEKTFSSMVMLKRNAHGDGGTEDVGLKEEQRRTVIGEEDTARDLMARTMKRGSLVTLRRQPRSYGILLVPLLLFNNALSQSRVLFTRFRKYSRIRKKKGEKRRGGEKKSLINIRPERRSFCSR